VFVDVIIRAAQVGELEEIISLQTLALVGVSAGCRRYNARQVDSLVTGQAVARRDCWSSETILVAEGDGSTGLTVSLPNGSPTGQGVVGFICLSNFEPMIQGIFVHPDFMGLGIGGRLLMAIEQLGLQRRFREMVVMSSIEATGFYERYGYVIQGSSGFYTAEDVWIPCQMLRKDLDRVVKVEAMEPSYGVVVRFVVTVLLVALGIVVLKNFGAFMRLHWRRSRH
jgi:ribosomal protein S18 acetylase RimI-like enzyme